MSVVVFLLAVYNFVGVSIAQNSINSVTFTSQSAAAVGPVTRNTATEDDPNYGITWALMPDGFNVLQVAYLVPQEQENEFDVDMSGIYFRLYTRGGGASEKVFSDNMAELQQIFSAFDPSKVTKFIVHGWMASEEVPQMRHLREQYIREQDVNAVIIDWRKTAGATLYIGSVQSVKEVGEHLARFIDTMVVELGADLSRCHIIGMSLGAHVSGIAGSNVTSGKVARITGLDPAGPGFFLKGPNMRLDVTDAEFVDVIHTAAGSFGHFLNLGHVDFYPNGGVMQPNCIMETIQNLQSCSHGRALVYFTESIGNDNFYGYTCRSYDDLEQCSCNTSHFEMMGEYVSVTARGVYYVQVGGEPPFARGPIDAEGNCGGQQSYLESFYSV